MSSHVTPLPEVLPPWIDLALSLKRKALELNDNGVMPPVAWEDGPGLVSFLATRQDRSVMSDGIDVFTAVRHFLDPDFVCVAFDVFMKAVKLPESFSPEGKTIEQVLAELPADVVPTAAGMQAEYESGSHGVLQSVVTYRFPREGSGSGPVAAVVPFLYSGGGTRLVYLRSQGKVGAAPDLMAGNLLSALSVANRARTAHQIFMDGAAAGLAGLDARRAEAVRAYASAEPRVRRVALENILEDWAALAHVSVMSVMLMDDPAAADPTGRGTNEPR